MFSISFSSKPRRTVRSDEFQRIANAKKEFNIRFNGQTPDKARLTMYDMIYYNPTTNPMKSPAVKPADIKERRESSMSRQSTGGSIKERRLSNASLKSHVSSVSSKPESVNSIKKEAMSDAESSMPVPQLKLGPNGEIMLDEKSLVIETTGDKEARETLANADVVYDDEFSGSKWCYM